MRALLSVFAIALVILSPTLGVSQVPDPGVTQLGPEFTSEMATVNDVTLHYVRGGTGPAVILLHGYPQDWYEWHEVMPRLAERFTVIAVDLRGIGGSEVTTSGYDAATLAEDIHSLVRHLELSRVYLAGHDIGGMVAYAYARMYPEDLRGAMILDVPLPGIEPWAAVRVDPLLWHFEFHQTPRVPEALVEGRQATYFRLAFFNRLAEDPSVFSGDEVARYAESYAAPDRLRAGFEFYRAFPANARFNQSHRSPIDLPIVLVGGEHAVGQINPVIAGALRKLGATNVTTELIRNSGHYVADEQPNAVAALIERYAAN